MQPLIEAEDIEIRFGPLVAVAGVSLQVWPEETLGLVGESGSGKTTLGRALLGLAQPDAGTVRFEGRDLASLGRAERRRLRRACQIFFQDPVASLSPRLTFRALLEEPLRIHGLPVAEHWPRVEALLAALGLAPNLLDKHPHEVSGGQARRLGIVRALALEPRFVVADEPTAGLDVSAQGDLLNLLADLRARFRLTYLLISHNLDAVRRATDRTAVMYLGQIVESGPTAVLFAAPAHPYTAALVAANPAIDPARRGAREPLEGEIPSPLRPPPGCRFHTRCPRAEARCRVEPPAAREVGEGRWASCHFPLPA
jgi:peptide/nickel transport system ATP-binding protein